MGDTAITVTLELGEVQLKTGDLIKIAKHVYSEPAVRHPAVLGTKYSIHLDNGDFADDGRLFFDTVALEDQDIVLKHTEVRYNLLVSLEWDAAELYVDGLRKDFRYMSDYLYDVSDGQLRLDTIVMLDDGAVWNQADVRIRASNVHNPDAVVGGMHHVGDYPINMPRKWFGGQDDSRYYTYVRHPLMDELSDNYRTIAHELGHFALGFYDEYECTDGLGNPVNCCTDVMNPQGNFGLMQYQYDRSYLEPFASEMSSDYLYQTAGCRTTEQWRKHTYSCWGLFEFLMEDPIDGIYVSIRKPHLTDTTERRTPVGLNYFPGPNDDPFDLDYDVGRLVRFTSPILPPSPNVRSVRVRVNGVPAGGAAVSTEQVATGWIIDQGKTTDDGWIWALGVDVTQDIIEASGFGFAEVPPGVAAANRRLTDRVWLSGSSEATAEDSVVVEMSPVDGHFPFICEGRLVGSSWEYYLTAEFLLDAPPSVSVSPSSGAGSYAFNPTYQGYSVLLPEDTAVEGSATVRAVDNSAAPFSFPTRFKRIEIDTVDYLSHLIGPGGDVIVRLDTANSAVQTLLFLSSPYPVPLNGLPINATQVGQAHSLSVEPDTDLQGMNTIRLYYAETDLTPISGFSADEEALQIHQWDSTTYQWMPLESLVDTALNFVSAVITETGVYTLFAVQYPTDVDDDDPQGSLPYRFELSQNYPNPFNPVTSIEYSLPERSHVTIEVFNVLGRRVNTLVDREEAAGSYRITWNATDDGGLPMSTGVYLYRFRAGEYVQTKKMLLLK